MSCGLVEGRPDAQPVERPESASPTPVARLGAHERTSDHRRRQAHAGGQPARLRRPWLGLDFAAAGRSRPQGQRRRAQRAAMRRAYIGAPLGMLTDTIRLAGGEHHAVEPRIALRGRLLADPAREEARHQGRKPALARPGAGRLVRSRAARRRGRRGSAGACGRRDRVLPRGGRAARPAAGAGAAHLPRRLAVGGMATARRRPPQRHHRERAARPRPAARDRRHRRWPRSTRTGRASSSCGGARTARQAWP